MSGGGAVIVNMCWLTLGSAADDELDIVGVRIVIGVGGVSWPILDSGCMTQYVCSCSHHPKCALCIAAPIYRRNQLFSLGLYCLRKAFHVDILPRSQSSNHLDESACR